MKTIEEYIKEYLFKYDEGDVFKVMSEGRVREVMKKYAEDVVNICGNNPRISDEHYQEMMKVKQQIK